jgi:DnaJ like chaperone protein
MGWFGKVLGGTIGMAVGGPPGAIAGLAIGHGFFDKDDLDINSESYSFTITKDNQNLYLSSIFIIFAHICVIEKGVTRRKILYLEDFIDSKLKFDVKKRNSLVKFFNKALKTSPDINAYGDFFHEFYLYEDISSFTLKSLIKFSLVNGEMDKKVGIFLEKLSLKLDIKSSFKSLINSSDIVEIDPYAILDCCEDDSLEIITKSYRNLVSIYHPDKNKNTLDKFLKIQEAYEKIKRSKGLE